MNVSSIIDQVTRHVYGAIAQLSAAVSPSGSFPSHLYSERRTMSELGYLFAEEVMGDRASRCRSTRSTGVRKSFNRWSASLRELTHQAEPLATCRALASRLHLVDGVHVAPRDLLRTTSTWRDAPDLGEFTHLCVRKHRFIRRIVPIRPRIHRRSNSESVRLLGELLGASPARRGACPPRSADAT